MRSLPFLVCLLALTRAPLSSDQNASPPAASPEPGPQAVLVIDELMRWIMKPAYVELQKAVAKPPRDRAAWSAIYEASGRLAELSNLLLIHPQTRYAALPAWPGAALGLRQAAKDVAAAADVALRSARAEDFEAVRTKYDAVSGACTSCHRTLRTDGPTIKP